MATASKFSLKQTQLGIRNGHSDAHRRQQVGLLDLNRGDIRKRNTLVNSNPLRYIFLSCAKALSGDAIALRGGIAQIELLDSRFFRHP